MILTRYAFAIATLAACCTSNRAEAEIDAQVIEAGKAATALVVLPSGRGFGTAFCINEEGYFLTNEHVAQYAQGTNATLVIQPGEKDETSVEAVVVRQDKETDIALLKAVAKRDFTALKLGEAEELYETQQVFAFGYPFGTALKVKEQEYPNVSINVGRVTSLRQSNGRLEQIQLDAQLNQGNSGGPVLNAKGEVVGVVRAGVRVAVRVEGRAGVLDSGVNFAIPVSHVQDFLASPEITFDPPLVPYADRFKPVDLTVRVASFLSDEHEDDVQVVLNNPLGGERRLRLSPEENGLYRASVAVLEKPEAGTLLPVEIIFPDGRIRGAVADGEFKVGKLTSHLRDVRSIVREGDGWRVTSKSGQAEPLKSSKLTKLTVYVGGGRLPINLDQAETVTIYQPPQAADAIDYRVEIRRDGELIASKAGRIPFSDVPETDASESNAVPKQKRVHRPPTDKVQFDEPHRVTRLPAPYDQYTLGGSGRFMIFHLKEKRSVVVLDLLSGRVVHQIEDISDDVLLAAGANKLMVVIPSQKLLQRWSLETFEREKVGRLPGKGTTGAALMGSNGGGPLLLVADDVTLFDIDAMEPIDVAGDMIAGRDRRRMPATRISANGLTVGSIPTGFGPVGYNRLEIDGRKTTVTEFGSTSNAIRWAQPTADGTLMLLPGSLYSTHLEEIEVPWLEGTVTLPTVDPRYFLAAAISEDQDEESRAIDLHFCTVADQKIIHTFVGLEELAPTGNTYQRRDQFGRHARGGEQLIHWIPWANLLVTLEYDNQKIHLRRFDLWETLDQREIDYLFVDSIPPSVAFRGQSLHYQVHARSSDSEVMYRLASGPEELSVSPAGQLVWRVPGNYVDASAQVIVAVSNSDGKETFHSFRVDVRDVDTVQ